MVWPRPDGLVRLADELGIAERVTFLPPQSRADLATLFQAANLGCGAELFGVVRPGRRRGTGLRTPVVAAAVGGLPVAVRDGITGTLVSGHDVGRWADALDKLLRPARGAGRRDEPRGRRARGDVLVG